MMEIERREEAMKKRLEAASESRREKILDKAAEVIQLAWAKHRESAPAAPKAEPEGKGGKKGKKGKKGKNGTVLSRYDPKKNWGDE